ncbi:MAG: hypothetical protein Q9191_003790 [Dirinaria sp. TL-2023a]
MHMWEEAKEERRWSQLVRQQQEVVNRTDDPREQRYFHSLVRQLENAKAKVKARKARQAKARHQPPPQQSSVGRPKPEQSSISARPTNREARAIKARERVEKLQGRLDEARAVTASRQEQVQAADFFRLDLSAQFKILEQAANAAKNVADLEQELGPAREQVEKTERYVALAHQKVRQREEEKEAAEAAEAAEQQRQKAAEQEAMAQIEADRNTALQLKAEEDDLSPDVEEDLCQESEAGNAVVDDAGEFTALPGTTNLDDEGVNHAIAAVIVGIAQENLKMGIASDEMQMLSRFPLESPMPCLTSPNNMVIPILSSAAIRSCDEEAVDGTRKEASEVNQSLATNPGNKGEWVGDIGHWILAVATRDDSEVDLRMMNSLPGAGSKSVWRAIARSIVRNCGWMKDTRIIFREED